MPRHIIHHTTDVPSNEGLRNSLFDAEQVLHLFGSAPVSVRQKWGSFHLSVDDVSIGTVEGAKYYTTELHLTASLSDAIPADLMEAVLSRIRPLAAYVQRTLDEGIRRERAVETAFLDHAGPVDFPRVKAPYAGTMQNVNALLFPDIAAGALGEDFTLDVQRVNTGDIALTANYQQDGVSFPAFRVMMIRQDNDRNPEVEIWGRGNREKARQGFVADILDRALSLAQIRAKDEGMHAAARRLRNGVLARVERVETLFSDHERGSVAILRNPDAKPEPSDRLQTALDNSRGEFSRRELTSYGRFGEMGEEIPLGNGFTVSVPLRDPRFGQKISYQGHAISSPEMNRFLPGVPKDVATILWFASRFAIGAAHPEVAKNHPWTDPSRSGGAEAPMTPEAKIRAAFSSPEP